VVKTDRILIPTVDLVRKAYEKKQAHLMSAGWYVLQKNASGGT